MKPIRIDAAGLERMLGPPPRRGTRPLNRRQRIELILAFSLLFLNGLYALVAGLQSWDYLLPAAACTLLGYHVRLAQIALLSLFIALVVMDATQFFVPGACFVLVGWALRRLWRGEGSKLLSGTLRWSRDGDHLEEPHYIDEEGRVAVLSRVPAWAKVIGWPSGDTPVDLHDLTLGLGHSPEAVVALITKHHDARRFAKGKLVYLQALATATERPITLRKDSLNELMTYGPPTINDALSLRLLEDETALPLRPVAIAWLSRRKHLSQRKALTLLNDKTNQGATLVAILEVLGLIGDESAESVIEGYTTHSREQIALAARTALTHIQNRARSQGATAGLSLSATNETGQLGLARPDAAGQLSERSEHR